MKTLTLYRKESSDPKRDAQLNLEGRTHWADDSTLRYFHCRILSSRSYADGRLFYVLFSQARDVDNTQRGYGYAIFAIDGHHIGGTALETLTGTRDAARKALTAALADIDPAQAVEDAIQRVHKAVEYEERTLRQTLASIAAKHAQATTDAEG